ncbi:MAG: hypothetical protein JXA69_09545 [Phycisphaerae bacterium]|nr:hypothetical protein [Phycisphaerae bacterium]
MTAANSRTLVVGIDEAGYGPLLGPLVVSAVAFRAPTALVATNWWEPLHDAITQKARVREPRLVVADSKDLSRRKDGLRLLERAALAFLCLPTADGTQRRYPPTLRGLLGQLNRSVVDGLREYPWYQDADFDLPAANDPTAISTQRTVLATSLARSGIEFVGAGSEILLEGHFNRLVGATRNKSVALLGQTIRLIQRMAQADGADTMSVYIDKQGGRQNYGQPLMTAFEDARLEIIEETDTTSAYRLLRPQAAWEIRFIQQGESHHLPIALASIFSKYVRELFMCAFNTFWRTHVPAVKATAGYYQDGLRFLKDIDAAIRTLQIDRNLLIRSR